MKLALWTLRTPKIDGIKDGVTACPYFAGKTDSIEYICENVPSDISDMPLTIEEIMLGAKNRADNLKKMGIDADYYVGIEGGTTRIGDRAYLFGCVYVGSASGEGHHGFSPFVEVPQSVDTMLYREGKDLGKVMGELSGRVNIASENGSMGAWTDDMLTRRDQFSVAFQAAIAPFFNQYYRL